MIPLQQNLQQSKGALVITGATGWVGRTALQQLIRQLTPSLIAQRVRLFASRAGSLRLEDTTYPVHPLQALPKLAAAEPLSAVLHTAFLTRDRLNAVGLDAYVDTNRWITRQVAQALELSPAARAVVISSGAASAVAHSAGIDSGLLARDPYGVLKREEEILLADRAPSLVLRIYALSGCFIRDPHRFALGDFLLAALRREQICIQAPMPVLRGYGHAGDIAALAWRWLLVGAEPVATPLATVSLNLDLLTLARRISDLYQLPPVQAAVDPQAPPNRYVADPAPFHAALAAHGLQPTGLDQQLSDTMAGLMAQSDGTLIP